MMIHRGKFVREQIDKISKKNEKSLKYKIQNEKVYFNTIYIKIKNTLKTNRGTFKNKPRKFNFIYRYKNRRK